MEIMVSLTAVSMGILAVFMYLRTREVRSPLLTLDPATFDRPLRAADVARMTASVRKSLNGEPRSESLRTDGRRFLYTAEVASPAGRKRITALLDGAADIIAMSETITHGEIAQHQNTPGA